jgi:hypothetical protein
MSANLLINGAEFDRTLVRYMTVTKRTLAEVLNKKALYIARGALRETRKTAKQEIEGLGVIGYTVMTKGSKNVASRRLKKAKAIYKEKSRAYNMVVAILRKAGKLAGVTEAELEKMAREFIAHRIRSIGYISSGWIPSIKFFSRVVGESADTGGVRPMAKGGARKAVESWSPAAELWNAVMQKIKESQVGKVSGYLHEALQRAFDKEVASMKTFVEDEWKKKLGQTS